MAQQEETECTDNGPPIDFLMELLLMALKDFKELGLLKEAGPHVHALMALAERKRCDGEQSQS